MLQFKSVRSDFAVSLPSLLAKLRDCRILCFGDVMLDVEVECSGGRASPEAPVMVVDEGAHHHRPGGAANVAANLAAMGARTAIAGLVGEDEEAQILLRRLQAQGIECHFSRDQHAPRPTTRKTRFVSDGHQLLRIDREESRMISPSGVRELMMSVGEDDQDYDLLLVSDYGKGVVSEFLMERVHLLAKALKAPLLVDPKGREWRRYGAADLIKPNVAELAVFTGLDCHDDVGVELALMRALELCDAKAILVTRGSQGASLLQRGARSALHIPACTTQVADVCGAGDTNLAMLGAMLAVNCDLPTAAELAQVASSLAVRQRGNAIVGAADMLAILPGSDVPVAAAIHERDDLVKQVRRWQASGLKVGFTNGCFDILHLGHIQSLEAVRSRCHRLIVAVNSDASVRRNKGAQRPIVGQDERAGMLASLAVVDAVVIFDEDTPEQLITAIRPDVLGKGGDYDPQTIAGGDFVRSYGGRVEVTPFRPGTSTTAIIDTIRDRLLADAAADFPTATREPGAPLPTKVMKGERV